MAPLWCWKHLIDEAKGTLKWGARGMALGTGYQRHVQRVMVYELMQFFHEIGCNAELNKGEGTITLPNEAQILLGSSENPNSLEGPHLDGFCWIDEAGMMALLAWEVALRRTNTHATPILITTVPYFENWLKSHVFDRWEAGDQGIEWVKCRTQDNLKYDRDSIERARATMRPEKFAAFYEGDWSRAFGLIYPRPDDRDLIVEPFDMPPDWPCLSGHDWGVNDPTIGLWARLDEEHDVLYVVAEYELGGETIDEHVRRWGEMGLAQGTDLAFGDPEGKELMLRANTLGYPVRAARLPGSAKSAIDPRSTVRAGIDLVYERLTGGRLKVLRGVEHLIDYRKRYVWDQDRTDEEKLLDRPKHNMASHMFDALRYLCAGAESLGQEVGNEPELSVLSTPVGPSPRALGQPRGRYSQ